MSMQCYSKLFADQIAINGAFQTLVYILESGLLHNVACKNLGRDSKEDL